MMTWDEFSAKFRKISENTDPDILRIIVEEFGDLKKLAFGILEMTLYDRMKYNDISFAISGDRQCGYNVVDAQCLASRLEDFKKDFLGESK